MVLGVLVVDVQPSYFSIAFDGEPRRATNFITAWNTVLDELSREYCLLIEMKDEPPTLSILADEEVRGVRLPRFVKNSVSAFSGEGYLCHEDSRKRRNLADELRTRGIDTLVVGGLFSDACVLSTIQGAKRAGFSVYTAHDLIDDLPLSLRLQYAFTSTMSYNVDSLLRKIEPYRLPR